MLYLAPPFHILHRVSVFRDHEDPLQWYYLPGPPRLTQAPDTATGTAVPQVQVIKFRGSAGSGGFLNFDVNLGVDPPVLDDIRDEIKRAEDLRDPPRLAPAPLIDGTVRMMLFDVQTGDAAPEPGSGLKFVLKLSHHAKPALYGDNQSAFSVQLSPEGVTTLQKALQGELSPIGIIYSLDYLALRPAYAVRLNIDWDRVQKHLDETFGTDTIFYESQISKVVSELIDNRVIEIETDTFVPEGEDESLMARRDQAVDEVREMITNAFFEPSLNPLQPKEEDAWDKIEHLAKTSSALAVTGGWSSLIGFSYRKIDYKRVDRKKLNVNIRERTTVKKTIYPQGHLSGLFQVLRRPDIDLSRFVLSVDLDDPWFAKRRVRVISRADIAEDAIASLNVHLNYGMEPKNVVLDTSTPTAEVVWNSTLDGGAMRRDVAVRYEVNFKGVDGTERPISLESASEIVTDDNLEIRPRELYSIVPIPIQALNFPWDRYTHVEVQTEYGDPDHGIRQADAFLLSKDQTEAMWRMFVLDPVKTRFRYKLLYRAADHRDVEMGWVETGDERLTIRDPFPSKRTLEIVPVFNWAKVDRAFVDVSYEDRVHELFEEASYEFTEKTPATQRFTVALKDPDRRLVAFRVTGIHKDGSLVEVPQSFTLERRIVVREDMRGHRIIAIRPQQVDFGALKLRDVVVEARYEDPDHGLGFADSFTFKSATDRAHFEYDFVDGGPPGYSYRISRRFTNGLTRDSDWEAGGEAELIVPLR